MSTKSLRKILSIMMLVGMLLSLGQPIIVGADSPIKTEETNVNSDLPGSDLPSSSKDDDSTKIEPLVLKEMGAEGQTDFFVWLSEKADLSPAYQLKTKQEKGQYVYNTLRATAERSQQNIREYLDERGVGYQAYYIANKILVRGGSESMLYSMAARPEVTRITANHLYQLEEPEINPKSTQEILAVEPNISFVNADDAWNLGITGNGVVLAGNDTGLDWQHPAIKPHYRGWNGANADHNYNWWDATDTYPSEPVDGMGHGTHTTGTMVGDDGGTNQIGIAPGAKTVHCKNMDDGGGGFDEWFIECFQWDLAPWDLNGANPQPDLAPDAVNNSWGYWGGGYLEFSDEIAALQAAGILVEVSAGNEGPECATLRSPGDYSEVLTTGSVSHDESLPGNLTYFSSRGPSSLSADYLPDVMAPGENIRSAVPGGDYQNWDGTSMAGPHVTGLIGLMWDANPGLRGMVPETQQIIFQTTVPLIGQTGSNCGGDYTTGPNNDWGYGTINALAAVQAAMSFGGVGTLEGTVTEQGSGNPLEGVQIVAELNPALAWRATTDSAGYFSRLVFSGTYTVTASQYGYYPEVETGVVVVEDATKTLDIELEPAPFYTVNGRVTDAAAGWPLYARIDIEGYPYGSVWTDPVSGEYSISLAAGVEYNFHVTAWVDGYYTDSRTVGPFTADQTEDFGLQADLAACSAPGYVPEFVYFEDFELDNGVYTTTGTTSFEWGAPSSGPSSAHSGSNAWATNLSGNYFDNENGSLVSPDIDLSTALNNVAGGGGGAGEPVMVVSWWQYLQTEQGWDYAWVEVSNDGGNSWMMVYGPETGQIDTQWTKYTAYLDSSYAVSNFRIRFTLQSDYTITDDGFYVDDIGIGMVAPPPNLYVQDFNLNNGGYSRSGPSSWEWGIPTRGPDGAYSAPYAWGTNLSGNYHNNENGTITSPIIDLSSGADQMMMLSWWQWLQTESNYDFASVEVYDGISWSTVYTASGIIDTEWTRNSVFLDENYAVSDFQVRFHLVSDETVTYPGFYIDDVNIDIYTGGPPAVPCDLQPGGLVVGIVYDANLNQGLVGAKVDSSVDQTLTLPTQEDPSVEDGFYTLFALAGPQEVTAYLNSSYGIDLQTPTILLSDTIRQDFSLVAGYLETEPGSLEITLDKGMTSSLSIDLSNNGGMPTNYQIGERNRGFLPLTRVSTLSVNNTPADGNSGQAPDGYQSTLTLPAAPVIATGDDTACIFKNADPWGVIDTEEFLTANGIPFNVYTSKDFGSLDFSECQMIIFSSDQPQDFYDDYAMYVGKFEAYVENGGFLNFFSADAGWNFGFLSAPLPGGMIWNPFYSGSNEVVDPDHPVVQGVPSPFYGNSASHGGFSSLPEEAHIIATDPSSGLPTIVEYPIGSGWLIAFGQPLEISHNWGWDGGLILENTLLWGHSFLPLNVPWLDTLPISGTLMGGATDTITAYFDASVPEVDQPGTYMANIRITNDTPYGALLIPITMNINAPQDWGNLTGTVNGLDRCDTPGVPIQGAEVAIESMISIKTDGDGVYNYWLAEGSYQVSISSPGYITQTFNVDIIASQQAIYDVDLRLDSPCGEVSSETIEITLPEGTTFNHNLTIGNTGAGVLNFTFLESMNPLELIPTLSSFSNEPAGTVTLALQRGPTSIRAYNVSSFAPASVETPVSGWFGGLDLPGGLVRYAFAQCAEQPDSYYVFSGVDANFTISTKSWRYDAATNTWTQLAEMPSGGEAPAAACYQGKIFVMGGNGTDLLYIYDIAGNNWTSAANLPRGVEGAAAAAWDGKVYLIGGDDDFYPGSGVSNEVNIYDIATDTWLNGSPMPIAAGNAGFAQIGPDVYVVGGWGENSPSENLTTTQRYNITSDSWELGPTFDSARADFAVAATEQALYALGGDEDGNSFFDATDRTERLDLSTWPNGAWSDLGDPLPLPLTSNNAGFCTRAVMDSEVAEIWSLGGFDVSGYGSIVGRALFHEQAGESCFSIYSDVPWLSETPASGEVLGDDQGNVILNFDASALTPGLYTATLALITDDPGASLVVIPVRLNVIEATQNVIISPDHMNLSGWAGETLTYTLKVTNLGNTPDTFDVTTSSFIWETTFPATLGPIEPNEEQVLQVIVKIPQDAWGGDSDMVVVTVTSSQDNLSLASATLTSAVNGPWRLWLPVIRR